MPSWKQKQPSLEDLLDADIPLMISLSTMKSIPYHRAIIKKLEELLVGSHTDHNKWNYRNTAAELYRANLMSLLRYS